MKIVAITLARNEEKIIPYFIHHYSDIVDRIVLLDHESTDNTVDVAKKVASEKGIPLDVITVNNTGYDDVFLKQIKENAYKMYRGKEYDVVIVVDSDELWHHPEGTRECIEEAYRDTNNRFVLKPQGYQMVSESFPAYSGDSLFEKVTEGVRDHNFDKLSCFSIDLNLVTSFGMHASQHFNESNQLVTPLEDRGILLLHCKFLGNEHFKERIRNSADNLSDVGHQLMDQGVAVQFRSTDEGIESHYNYIYDRRQHLNL